jgi:hypothetical protein
MRKLEILRLLLMKQRRVNLDFFFGGLGGGGLVTKICKVINVLAVAMAVGNLENGRKDFWRLSRKLGGFVVQ